jgi:IS1 family transposase
MENKVETVKELTERLCSFYVDQCRACQNAYCYYPTEKHIICPARKEMVEKHGNWNKRFLHETRRDTTTFR